MASSQVRAVGLIAFFHVRSVSRSKTVPSPLSRNLVVMVVLFWVSLTQRAWIFLMPPAEIVSVFVWFPMPPPALVTQAFVASLACRADDHQYSAPVLVKYLESSAGFGVWWLRMVNASSGWGNLQSV